MWAGLRIWHERNRKKASWLAATLLLLIFSVTAGVPSALASPGTVSLSSANEAYRVGQNIVLRVSLATNDSSVAGARVDLGYDSSKLEYVGIDFFPSDFNIALTGQSGESNGIVTLQAAHIPKGINSQSAVLADVVFRVLVGEGVTEVTVEDSAELIEINDTVNIFESSSESISFTIVGDEEIDPVTDPVEPITEEGRKLASVPGEESSALVIREENLDEITSESEVVPEALKEVMVIDSSGEQRPIPEELIGSTSEADMNEDGTADSLSNLVIFVVIGLVLLSVLFTVLGFMKIRAIRLHGNKQSKKFNDTTYPTKPPVNRDLLRARDSFLREKQNQRAKQEVISPHEVDMNKVDSKDTLEQIEKKFSHRKDSKK